MRLHFFQCLDPYEDISGKKKFFHRRPCPETAILCLDRYMDGAGQALIHFLTKSAKRLFHNAQKEAIWQKKFLKLVHRGKSAKMEKKPFYCQIAILALLPLCINFKIFFCQMASF